MAVQSNGMQKRTKQQRAGSRIERITQQRKRRLQLNNEVYKVGVLKGTSQPPPQGDPSSHVYIYFVNSSRYCLQDGSRREVCWENVEFRKGYAARNLEELAVLVIGRILNRTEKEYIRGEV